MKKSFLLIPAIALTLSGCSLFNSTASDTATTAEETVENTTGAAVETANAGWQNGTQAAGNAANQTVQAGTQAVQSTTTVATQAAQTAGSIYVPRDTEGKPIYSQITKGSYTGSTYTVQEGDTLYLISYLSGKDVATIANLNGISSTSKLKVGQVLNLQ